MSPEIARRVAWAFGLASLLFLLAPGLDLWASGLVHGGVGFVDARAVGGLREAGETITLVAAAAVVLAVLLKMLWPRRRMLIDGRATLFLASTLLLGPFLIVNLLLKDQWGRPRPWMVEEFGGDLVFQPVWLISDQCGHNCSFVSGETAGSFWLLALAALAPACWRPAAYALVCAFAATIGVYRVLAGGHFASDVLLAALITYLCVFALHHALYVRDPAWSRPPAIEDALARAALYVRGRIAETFRAAARAIAPRAVERRGTGGCPTE